MKGTIQIDGSCFEPFLIENGVKQGCVLAPTLFGNFFSLIADICFDDSKDGIYTNTQEAVAAFSTY